MSYYVYIANCEDSYLYTGITNNLRRRIIEHGLGLSRPTKNRGEVKLVHSETFQTRIEAARREKEIKGWRREKKERLVGSLHRGEKFTPR